MLGILVQLLDGGRARVRPCRAWANPLTHDTQLPGRTSHRASNEEYPVLLTPHSLLQNAFPLFSLCGFELPIALTNQRIGAG
jgi:hypothetical protein